MRTLLKGADILLRKEDGYETLRGACLGIDGTKIDYIGTERPQTAYDLEKDMTGKLLAPGLINCHSHIAMTLMRGIGSGLPLQDWLFKAIFPIEDRLVREDIAAASVVSGLTGLELDGWMGLGVALFILWSGVGILKETVDPLLGEAPSEELTDYIGKKVMSYDGVLGTHDLMVHDYGPGRRFASVHVEMAAENDVMQSHDIIDNIERDFQENDHISLIIHYDPILTGDDAVGTAREWVKELVRSISPELSIHDFRMVQGPSHTNLIFDTVVPHNFPLSDAALRKRIQSLVETHDAGETKYYAVVTIDHSYAAIPGACKTDGKE